MASTLRGYTLPRLSDVFDLCIRDCVPLGSLDVQMLASPLDLKLVDSTTLMRVLAGPIMIAAAISVWRDANARGVDPLPWEQRDARD